MLGRVIAFVEIIGSVKFLNSGGMARTGTFHPTPAVTTVIVKQSSGTPRSARSVPPPVNGVTVSADLPGVVEEIAFDSGRWVRKGDVLVRLNANQERAQLAAAEAQRELARLDLARKQELLGKAVIPQAMYDQVAAEFKQAEARAGEIRAAIERKTIRAPSRGAGHPQINLGQYLAGGSPIVSLQALQPVYVNFTVPRRSSAG